MTDVNKLNTPNWQPKIGESGAVVEDYEDIVQCLNIIFTTQKGSDPHRPEFGSDVYKYIDQPTPSAVPKVVKACFEAAALWEPRVTLLSALPIYDGAHVTIGYTIELKESGEQIQAEARIQ
ncbi:MAG: GPW/gp25 family protein [Campylobacterales bacterium]|nr:GPW/gp25 family protein [Campylobacterales bacterium]